MKLWIYFLLGAGLGVTIPDGFTKSKSFDELKWERLAKQRELRRATEQRYEACMAQCRRVCK